MVNKRPSKQPTQSDKGPAGHTPLKKQVQEMKLLLGISRQIATIETLDELLAAIVDISARETDSERGTLFLNDDQTGELYSRVAQGSHTREIRILNDRGIAGHVFTTGKGVIIHDAYADSRFNREIDQETGYVTKRILCAPIRTVRGEVIGVLEMLNKKDGPFTEDDLRLLEAMCTQSAITLRNTQFLERMKVSREREMKFMDVVSEITAEIDLSTLLAKVMSEATRMLQAERGTIFLYAEKTNELFSRIAMGDKVGEIRMPSHLGIAGAVFTTGQTINIPYAYADLRFNPAFDKKTGFFTRSILCVPIFNKDEKVIGVTQVLNKCGGAFTKEDESRLKAFTGQLAISLENAKLFDDVQNMKNYNESMLESMSNGVVTLNEDGRVVTCNDAGLRILRVTPTEILGKTALEFFTGANQWIAEKVMAVGQTLNSDLIMDVTLAVGSEVVSANLMLMPLMSGEKESETDKKPIGTMIMVEDISSEKRMKSTMSRYMDPGLAEQLLAGGEDVLGGKSVIATVLFSDVRDFTSLTEEIGAHQTVKLLNEYFTIMVDCIRKQGGMLDKFIGDAIMAVFGLPMPHEDDEDRAVRAAISMITELWCWNSTRKEAGLRPIDMGIGLNTDSVVSGNIGSPKRMDYTIIGDGVNLASRLESGCKQYASRILISQNTCQKLRGTYRLREVDWVVVKGKTEPVAIYEVLDYHNDETFPNLLEVVNYFKGGLAQYRKGNWEKAMDAFREAIALNPGDRLSQIYVDRCLHLRENPPAETWNGIWVMKTK
jgi:adenylate cyclase